MFINVTVCVLCKLCAEAEEISKYITCNTDVVGVTSSIKQNVCLL